MNVHKIVTIAIFAFVLYGLNLFSRTNDVGTSRIYFVFDAVVDIQVMLIHIMGCVEQ